MPVTISESEEGKDVVQDGETVGKVIDVDHGTAYVDPDPGITDKLLAKLGWADRDEDSYPLQEQAIEAVDDDRILLQSS